jgi:hypothetical protein
VTDDIDRRWQTSDMDRRWQTSQAKLDKPYRQKLTTVTDIKSQILQTKDDKSYIQKIAKITEKGDKRTRLHQSCTNRWSQTFISNVHCITDVTSVRQEGEATAMHSCLDGRIRCYSKSRKANLGSCWYLGSWAVHVWRCPISLDKDICPGTLFPHTNQLWFPRHKTRFRRNFAEILFCQDSVSFRFGEISSKNSAKRNEILLLYIYFYICSWKCVRNRVHFCTC